MRHWQDKVLLYGQWSGSLLSIGFVIAIATVLLGGVLPFAQDNLSSFWKDDSWFPTSSIATFGQLPMLITSFVLGILTLSGIFILGSLLVLSFWSVPPKYQFWVERIFELAAGIPSVIYGLWGLIVLVPWFTQFYPPGANLFIGAIVIGLMVLPTWVLMTIHGIRASISNFEIQSILALGMGPLQYLMLLLKPQLLSTLKKATILAWGRTLGETMVALMVCGNVIQWSGSPFDSVRTLTAHIALELPYAELNHRSALYASALSLVLLILTSILLLSLSKKIIRRSW